MKYILKTQGKLQSIGCETFHEHHEIWSRTKRETISNGEWKLNLTKVKPLFTLSHRGSDNTQLLIVFSANYIDHSIVTFIRLKVVETMSTSSKIVHCVYRTLFVDIMMQYANTKFIRTWTRSSDLCDSINRGLTLVRLLKGLPTYLVNGSHEKLKYWLFLSISKKYLFLNPIILPIKF